MNFSETPIQMASSTSFAPAFNCPTRVHGRAEFVKILPTLLDGASWALIASPFIRETDILVNLERSENPPTVIYDGVTPNPTISEIIDLAAKLPSVDILVAVGGGSVIDTAKGTAALAAIENNAEFFKDHLAKEIPLPDSFTAKPLIAVPTTSGTGSEVTQWATIWGDDGAKYSLSHRSLYPKEAILDPGLCSFMPREVTLYSALDALSHAMESIWNVKHSPITDALAKTAIQLLRNNLGRTLESPDDLDLRSQIQTAALMAGFSMGTTQTALAHSISYPITSDFGMPHGFACSFTLAEIARFNGETDPERLSIVAEAFGCDTAGLANEIIQWFCALGVPKYLAQYAKPEDIDTIEGSLINPARAKNNIRWGDNDIAVAIAKQSLASLAPSI